MTMAGPDWRMLAEAVYAGCDLEAIEIDDLTDDVCALCGYDEEQTRLLDGRVVCMPCRAAGDLR